MRLPLAGNISTKDGASNKNARMVNVLAEEKQGKTFAAVRPCLSFYASTNGNGNGMVCFNGTLVNVFGATIGIPTGDVLLLAEVESTISEYIIFHGVKLNNGLYVLCDGTYVGTGEAGNIFTTTGFATYTKKLTDYTYFLGRMIGNSTVAICSYADEDSNVGIAKVNTAGTTTLTATATQINPICFGNGVFVATTSNQKFATSANGTTWAEGTYSLSYVAQMVDVQWNGEKYCMFYMLASDTHLYSRVSANLTNWSSAVQVIDTILAGGSGDICITTASNYFVIVLGNTVLRSDDGLFWETYYPFQYDFESYAVAYNDISNKLCAVGGTYDFADGHARYASFDKGKTWFPDAGTYLTPPLERYTGVIPHESDFVTFTNQATNDVQVLSGVGFGITDVGMISDDLIDFAIIP